MMMNHERNHDGDDDENDLKYLNVVVDILELLLIDLIGIILVISLIVEKSKGESSVDIVVAQEIITFGIS